MELQIPKQFTLKQESSLFQPESYNRVLLEKRQKLRMKLNQRAAEVPVLGESPEVVLIQQPQQIFEDQIGVDDREQIVLFEDASMKQMEVQTSMQQDILPQEVVVVSYNDEVPSETGVIAYDEHGRVLLIRESDIKSVDSYKAQHLIHTFDGTTYIIDSNTETAAGEPTYIVWDKPLVADEGAFVIEGLSVDTIGATEDASTSACIVTGDCTSDTYGFQNWNDFEIYQAMTAFRIAETSETSTVLTQSPIMSTVENPSCVPFNDGYKFCLRPDNDSTCQSLEDSLAKIGVITSEASNIPSTLQLPSTITDPSITSSILNVAEADDEESNNVIYANGEYWQ